MHFLQKTLFKFSIPYNTDIISIILYEKLPKYILYLINDVINKF